MLRLFLALVMICVTTSSVVAQELAPPPPPPELDETDGTDGPGAESTTTDTHDADNADPKSTESAGELLAITEPLAGQQVGTSTVIKGTAPVGQIIEVRIDGEVETRMKVDGTGTFEVAVSDLPPNTRVRIEVAQIDRDGEVLTSTSIVARTGEKSAEIAPPPPVDPEPEAAVAPPTEEVQPDPAPEKPGVKPMMGRLPRAALATAGGVGLGFVGAVTGFILGGMVALATADGDGDFSELGYLVFGTLAGYAIGVPLGVYVTSYLLDGNGSLVLTVIATLAGLVGGSLLAAGLFSDTNGQFESIAAVTFVSAIGAGTGALVFELTSDPSRRVKEAEERAIAISPTVAPSADGRGMVFGLGGTF